MELSDAHFGVSVLGVSVDAREGKALPFCVAVADQFVRGEGASVGMIISALRTVQRLLLPLGYNCLMLTSGSGRRRGCCYGLQRPLRRCSGF